MLSGHDNVGEDLYVTIPRGGPLYVSNMVGPLTRVPNFENSVYQELQSLKEEISGHSSEVLDEEFLVDELRIITEDELVDRAFEEAFKGGELAVDASQATEEVLSPRADDKDVPGPDHACSQSLERDTQAIVPSGSVNVSPLKACEKEKSNKGSSRKRKSRKYNRKRKNSFDESYMEKVEQLARIKQKQEEDKASVRLHSFNGSSRNQDCGAFSKKDDKIVSLKSAGGATKVRSSNTYDNVPVGFPETILCFEVYHNKKKWLKTQEFLVLGRQLLTEVKDKIYCLTDEIMRKAGQYDPSGYFLIEDVFCNDLREPFAIDYSKPILDWLENSKKDALEKWECVVNGELQEKQRELLGSDRKQQELPRFRAVHMQSIRFCDIRFQLGAGYLYCHQGDCKHVVVLRDMRLVHPEDVQNRAAYPLITFQPKLRYRKCSVCKIYKAQKISVDDKWASSNPSYFCDVCYYMLHYANGSLLYSDFSVYDYHHE